MMTTSQNPSLLPSVPDKGSLSLASQFAIAGGIVMFAAMVVVGSWVSARIEETVVRNTANATAQYMESFISPLSQDLDQSDTLSPGALRALDEIFNNTPLGERVLSYKIWKKDGLIVDASDKTIVGQRFEVSDHLASAWNGDVVASFDEAKSAENAAEKALGMPLLEIYSPIREVWSGRVIGVAEFYEKAEDLRRDLISAKQRSWLAVALVMATIGALLYAIVLRGSRTIDQQRAALTAQVNRLAELSDHNTKLRLRVQQAAARASAMNDQSLRQIGADLHDGPAQLMGFAALRLDGLRPALKSAAATADLDQIDRAVKDAIREVRSISRGLSLPNIEERQPCDLVRGVVDAHEARTGTQVDFDCPQDDLPPLSPAVKICLYRFTQEGLNNAWRYAEGKGQQVQMRFSDGILSLAVRDKGLGIAADPVPMSEDGGMGLAGLRDRVESLGGTLDLRTRSDTAGAELIMTLDLGRV